MAVVFRLRGTDGKFVKGLINEVLKLSNSEKTFDDLFEFVSYILYRVDIF